jgi:Phage stabilisation protein
VQIPLLGLGLQGRSPNVSAQRRLNLYLEIHAEGRDKTEISAHGTPGLQAFYDFGETPIRGMHGVGDYLYVVHRFSLYRVNNAAVAESMGTLSTSTGAVGFADNGTQVMITDGTKGYIYTIATGVLAEISHADYPDNATSVTFLDGYFIVDSPSNPGRFYVSALYDGTTWNALAYATAESNPDNLVRPMAERSLLVLFGDYSTEIWANTGALDFPFSRMQGAAVEWGLAARASAVKFDDSLCWLARNRLGQVSVVRAAGLDIQRVSTPELDYLFSAYSAVSDATAFGFMLNGHPMYAISFPTASRSWLYDGKTGAWSEWQSYGLTRHRGATQTSFLNDIMIGDYSDGRVFKLKPDVLTDDGDTIVREIVSPHSFGADDETLFISEIRLDLETGVGTATGQGVDPQIMLSISRDGGSSFGTERWTDAGAIGNRRHRARWRRCGRARDMVLKLRISDPVEVNLLRATMDFDREAA